MNKLVYFINHETKNKSKEARISLLTEANINRFIL